MHDSVPAQFKSLATITTIVMRRFVLCYSPQLVAPSGAAIDGSRSSYQVACLRAMCHVDRYDWQCGFNVEAVEYKNISFTVWDVGGQDKNREQFTEQGNAIAFESKVNKIYLRIPNIIANEEQHSLSIAEMEGTLITRKVPQIQTRMYE